MSLVRTIPDKSSIDMASAKFTKSVTSGVCEELHECDWVIKNWELIQVDETLTKDQQFEVTTGNKNSLLAKFTIGLEVSAADANGNRFVGVYCKLMELTGTKTEVPVSFGVSIENVKDSGFHWQPAPITKSMKVQEMCNHPNGLDFNKSPNPAAEKYLSDGSLKIAVRIRVLNPITVPQSITNSMDLFQRKSAEMLRIDYGNLLTEDDPTEQSDVTIVSSDNQQFPCHRVILSARNRVFARMLSTDMAESKTGIINIKDLSGKTLKVLLHYLYTGQLLDTWMHPDVIVEFTQAAGRYQLDEVLGMMDNLLGGIGDKTSATATSFLLLELANKLNLQTAQKQLMERIVKFTVKAQNSTELLSLMESEVENKAKISAVSANTANVVEKKTADIAANITTESANDANLVAKSE